MSYRAVVLVAIVAIPAARPALAGAYLDCASAHNAAVAGARQWVSAVFNRIDCDASRRELAQEALTRVIARQILRTSDAPEIKRCWYAGLYEGLVQQLDAEYAACGQVEGFTCVRDATAGAFAGSVLAAARGTPFGIGINEDDIIEIFAARHLNPCDPWLPEACAAAVAQAGAEEPNHSEGSGPTGDEQATTPVALLAHWLCGASTEDGQDLPNDLGSDTP